MKENSFHEGSGKVRQDIFIHQKEKKSRITGLGETNCKEIPDRVKKVDLGLSALPFATEERKLIGEGIVRELKKQSDQEGRTRTKSKSCNRDLFKKTGQPKMAH